MNSKRSLSLYTISITIAGVGALGYMTYTYGLSHPSGLLFMAVLITIAESLSVPLDNGKAVSVGFAITLASLLSIGPVNTAWVAAAGSLLKVVHHKKLGYLHLLNIPIQKSLFNMSNYILSCLLAGGLYKAAGGIFVMDSSPMPLTSMFGFLKDNLLPITIAILTFLVVNSGILAILLGIINGQRAITQWISSFIWAIPNEFAIGLLGLIITIAYISYGPVAVILFFGPLVLARYVFKMYMEMSNMYFETISALTAAIEAKDKYTIGHSRRVEKYSKLIAQEMKLSPSRMQILKYAALLHDVGKIGISEKILNKPSRLSEDEFEHIKEHPVIGHRILDEVEFLCKTKDIVRSHHEYYDGSGYPLHLSAEQIPLESLIMSVADAFDAMTSDRPYRKALSFDQAVDIIKRESGKQFAPDVVNAFLKVVNRDRDALINI